MEFFFKTLFDLIIAFMNACFLFAFVPFLTIRFLEAYKEYKSQIRKNEQDDQPDND